MEKFKLPIWDSGHTLTGGDTGAEGNGIIEQNETRTVVNYVNEYCNYLGQQIRYAHCNHAATENESLNFRVNRQKSLGGDVFVSVHFNSYYDTSANGTECFILAPGGDAEPISKRINRKLVGLGFVDRTFGKGYKTAKYKILRETTCPAVLVEVCFISNKKDADLYKKLGAKRIAHAICEGLFDVKIPYNLTPQEPKERWCVKSYAYGSKEKAEEHAKYFKDKDLYCEVYQIE